jgi:hypothetical protein
MPSATNMMVNERQKTIAGPRMRLSGRSSPRSSSSETPETALR